MKKVLCIIPARGGSKRIPRKNILPVCGKPLINYTIEAAKESGVFTNITVSTDDDEIAQISEKLGITIKRRGEELSGDKVGVLDVCESVVKNYEKDSEKFDYLCVLLPTNPMRDGDDIKKAFEKFIKMDGDRLMAVTTFDIPPFWALKEEKGFLEPYFGMEYMIRSQDLPQVYVDNGSIYFFKMSIFKTDRSWFGSRLVSFPMPREKSIDIDEPFDIKIAEFFLKQK